MFEVFSSAGLFMRRSSIIFLSMLLALGGMLFFLSSCSSDKEMNRAKMTGAKYWVEKAYPGKAYDVQVVEAVKVEDGKFRVKALVDGETRVGVYDPKTESFDEGFYSLAHEKTKKVAELEEENRYLKDRVEKLEKEMFQMKLRMKYMRTGKGDPEVAKDASKEPSKDAPKAKEAATEKAKEEEESD